MATSKYIKPTESELEILRILWERHKASVRDVHEELSKTKEAGYTTTLKLMQIMFEKGLVGRDDSVKIHVYHPVVSREKTQKHLLEKIICRKILTSQIPIPGLSPGQPKQAMIIILQIPVKQEQQTTVR